MIPFDPEMVIGYFVGLILITGAWGTIRVVVVPISDTVISSKTK